MRNRVEGHFEDLGLIITTCSYFKHLKFSRFRAYNPRNKLMDHIYPDQRVVSDRTIDSHIKNLRKKISIVFPDTEVVHSVYGVGYKYELQA